MYRYKFMHRNHQIEIAMSGDGGEIVHDGHNVPWSNVDPTSTFQEGEFQVAEDGEECIYAWKVDTPSTLSTVFNLGNCRHTVSRNGEVILEVEVPFHDI